MVKIFTGITITIAIALVFITFAHSFMAPANSTTADGEIDWQVTVTGLVEQPLNLNWTEIVAMPKSSVNAEIICVDFPDTVVMQGKWTGIKLRTLLDEAEPSASAIKVAFYAADGYSTDLSLETAMRDDIILAYEKDGSPLNDLRLVVPGKWGYKWISMLTRIELVDYDFLGFWESRGYSDEATVSVGEQETGETQPLSPSNSPPATSTPPPETSPSLPPSQPPTTPSEPLDQSTLTPESLEDMPIPTEISYIIAVSAVAVVLVLVLMFIRKRTK